jgi:hypothetical protein
MSSFIFDNYKKILYRINIFFRSKEWKKLLNKVIYLNKFLQEYQKSGSNSNSKWQSLCVSLSLLLLYYNFSFVA